MDSESSNRYSDWLPPTDPRKWGAAIYEAVREITRIVGCNIRCLQWNDYYLAVAFEMPVNLPSGGTFDDVDIQVTEPVMILFRKDEYPEIAPMAWSDRRDFPAQHLPHLNPVQFGYPSHFCLYRGSLDDWFASHTLEDYLKRLRGWLEDAAAGMLIPANDQFEPTRRNDSQGSFIFSEKDFADWISKGAGKIKGAAGYGFVVAELLSPGHRNGTHLEGSLFTISHFSKARLVRPKILPSTNHCIGILAWGDQTKPVQRYFGTLPETKAQMLDFCQELKIPLDEALREYREKKFGRQSRYQFIPLILGIQRPQILLGSDLSIEPLCFVLGNRNNAFLSKLPTGNEARVFHFGHHNPLVPERARKISGHGQEDGKGRILLLGCGSLGSKLALHYGRSGQTAMTFVDNRSLTPHNPVRHALLGNQVGANKAEAVRDAIKGLYVGTLEPMAIPDAYSDSALTWLKGTKQKELDKYKWLIDATASAMVQESLISATLPSTLSVVQCGIRDEGKIGTLLLEGAQRNPRLDDLQAHLYDSAIEQTAIRNWLERERKHEEGNISFTEIALGVGCSSDTLPLSDDAISWHAATFSLSLKQAVSNATEGRIGINFLPGQALMSSDGDFRARWLLVEPVEILHPAGGSGWEVRMQKRVVIEIRQHFEKASPNETGGLLIGYAHPKRKVIYVTRTLAAPADSVGNRRRFRLGVKHLPENVRQVQELSGGYLGYVGQWHSHPQGSARPSQQDMETMETIEEQLHPRRVLSLMLIVNEREFYSYLSVPT